ncbi:MAG: CPBP family intramembrane metalloprotease [Crocinitomicaceae bacterium]|nr:CPBP family intramembrane metalloprotease [Crocinitomicaceae bacterium]
MSKIPKPKNIVLFLLIITLTISLVFVSSWTNGIVIFDDLSDSINKQILYQSITLFGTIIFLLILRLAKRTEFQAYFRKGKISADILPEPIIGIKPKPTENWFHIGLNFAIIISVVTAMVIYFQLIKDSGTSIVNILNVLPFSIVFALSNSFVEESITRLGVVVVLKDVLKDRTIPLISALIFGTVHYWGNPGGFLGVIVAGFLGWLLTKSILETKGIFWAWLIHFLQDVIIFSALLSI